MIVELVGVDESVAALDLRSHSVILQVRRCTGESNVQRQLCHVDCCNDVPSGSKRRSSRVGASELLLLGQLASPDMPVLPADDDAVFRALENDKYRWRTLSGLVAETGLPIEKVLDVLARNRGQIVKSALPSVDGDDLYTTRDHFRK